MFAIEFKKHGMRKWRRSSCRMKDRAALEAHAAALAAQEGWAEYRVIAD